MFRQTGLMPSKLPTKICYWLIAGAFSGWTAWAVVHGNYLDLASWTGVMAAVASYFACLLIGRFLWWFNEFDRYRRKQRNFGCRLPLFLVGGTFFMFVIVDGAFYVCDNGNKMQADARLRRLAMAMHEYEKVEGHLPPTALVGKDGQPLLSWRVLILPYLGERERQLCASFQLDEPWDSPHNRKLLAAMPDAYAPPKGFRCEPYSTVCKVFVGKGAIFEQGRNLTLAQVDRADGLYNTILIAAAGSPVPWTKPEDLAFDDEKLPNLTSDLAHLLAYGQTDRFRFAVGDGTIRICSRPQNEKQEQMIRALISWRGGERVDPGVLE